MILDFDIGNTRVKWRYLDQVGRILKEGVFLHNEIQSLPKELNPARVRMCAVNGPIAEKVCGVVNDIWRLDVEHAQVVDGVSGVHCGYHEPQKLGVDRWLAIIAAWHKFRESLLVIDAGSALTLDVVTKNGLHKGGLIVPGRDVMRTSLASNTWRVQVPGLETPNLALGRETSVAVNNGILTALVATVETVARRTGVEKIVITGGDAVTILHHLDTTLDVEYEPGLVIDGLAIAMP